LLEAAVEDLTRFITGEVKDFINSCSRNWLQNQFYLYN
jgi:hypothetical protein